MKIYTKKGDLGKTSIIGASNLDKHNIKIEAYGTVDELNSSVGLLRSFDHPQFEIHKIELIFVQDTLFKIGSILASTSDIKSKSSVTSIDIKEIENFIDKIESQLEELTSFILPGGNVWNGYAHLARSICRRAERRITALNIEEVIDENILIFINRLSDYLFVLARKINVINNVDEIKWNS